MAESSRASAPDPEDGLFGKYLGLLKEAAHGAGAGEEAEQKLRAMCRGYLAEELGHLEYKDYATYSLYTAAFFLHYIKTLHGAKRADELAASFGLNKRMLSRAMKKISIDFTSVPRGRKEAAPTGEAGPKISWSSLYSSTLDPSAYV